jgi:hypothetical protein
MTISRKTKMMAGRGIGMNPKKAITLRKGKSVAYAARTPKIAPEAPIVGLYDALSRKAWKSPAKIPDSR